MVDSKIQKLDQAGIFPKKRETTDQFAKRANDFLYAAYSVKEKLGKKPAEFLSQTDHWKLRREAGGATLFDASDELDALEKRAGVYPDWVSVLEGGFRRATTYRVHHDGHKIPIAAVPIDADKYEKRRAIIKAVRHELDSHAYSLPIYQLASPINWFRPYDEPAVENLAELLANVEEPRWLEAKGLAKSVGAFSYGVALVSVGAALEQAFKPDSFAELTAVGVPYILGLGTAISSGKYWAGGKRARIAVGCAQFLRQRLYFDDYALLRLKTKEIRRAADYAYTGPRGLLDLATMKKRIPDAEIRNTIKFFKNRAPKDLRMQLIYEHVRESQGFDALSTREEISAALKFLKAIRAEPELRRYILQLAGISAGLWLAGFAAGTLAGQALPRPEHMPDEMYGLAGGGLSMGAGVYTWAKGARKRMEESGLADYLIKKYGLPGPIK